MSSTKSLVHLIESLEKREFDTIIMMYLKNQYNFKKIILTDGKNDVGLDLKVFDFKERKRQYQLTTQKSATQAESRALQKKILEDLAKAQINHKEYLYENKLYFFYSYKLTNKFIRDLQRIADNDYDIELTIFDANYLAQDIEDIPEVKSLLLKQVGLNLPEVHDSSSSSLLYDLISFGKPTEFKNQIIQAYFYQIFLENHKLSLSEIKSKLEEKFKISENDKYYLKFVNQFLTDKILVKSEDYYSLSKHILADLKKKNDDFTLDRRLFEIQIESILKKYEQESFVENYITRLIDIYTNNFEKGIEEISSNKESYQFSELYQEFSSFIKDKLGELFDHKDLAIELLQYCKKTNFIQKIAASNVYVSKINDRKLDTYLNTSKKIFIDTSIALYSICYWYKPTSTFNNFFYLTVKNLLELTEKENITLYISERYIWEIQNQFKEAFKLVPFLAIVRDSNLGISRNVFYNFYQHLKSKENYEDSFFTFLTEFGIKEDGEQDSYNSIIASFLSNLKIEQQIIPKEYPIIRLNELFDNYLRKNHKVKTSFSKNCDSIMFAYLADKDVDVHKLDPIFLTWDKSFYEVHKVYSKEFPNNQKWLNLSPNKYLDSNALLKFSIDNETFTDNILAFLSEDIVNTTRALIDSLTIIINPNNDVGRVYTEKLGQLRENEINQIANNGIHIAEFSKGETVLDDIIFKLTDHYKETGEIQNFRSLFTKGELIEQIINLILESRNQFYESHNIDNNVFLEFDKLISEEKDSL